MASTPLTFGNPCWINIKADDVPRARRFYENVFGWKFRDSTTDEDGLEEPATEVAHFDLGDRCPAGGITRVEEGQLVKTAGNGGVFLYFLVEDLDEAMKKVKSAGGKQMTEVEPQGIRAFMQHFEDTEGNYGGLYMVKKM